MQPTARTANEIKATKIKATSKPPAPHAELPSRLAAFTCGEAAYLCCCSPAQINRLFRQRQLGGFRIGSEKRIPRDALIRFMEANGIPLDLCLQGTSPRQGIIKPRDMERGGGRIFRIIENRIDRALDEKRTHAARRSELLNARALLRKAAAMFADGMTERSDP
jgi:hypothetical protein